jgi:hypothetical protein
MVKLSRTNLAFFAFSFAGATVTAEAAGLATAFTGVFAAGLVVDLATGLVAALIAGLAAALITFTAGAFAAVFTGVCGLAFTTALTVALTSVTFDAAVAIFLVGTTGALDGVATFFNDADAMINSQNKTVNN